MTAQPAQNEFLPNLQRTAAQTFGPIQREFNRLFDELGHGWATLTDVTLSPRIDVRETKKTWVMTVEVPGVGQDDIKIDVEGDMLTVSGEKKTESETTEDNYRVSERTYGSFCRSMSLPHYVDAAKIKATMADGVLKISAPKNGSAETRSIKIQPAK